jgi:hypothetical protein
MVQQGPQANSLGAHMVAAVPPRPHVTAHSEPPEHVILQSPTHVTVQLDMPLQAMMPLSI